MRPYIAQTRTELSLAMRQGEQLLVSLGLPLLLLVFFSQIDVLPLDIDDPIEFLAPGVLALAIMSTAMVSLGISTGFERQYKVLKRLGTTPLGRPRLLASKATLVLAIEVVQLAILIPTSLLLGWDPTWGIALALAALVLGTAAFAGIGLALAGSLPGPVNLAACNALYLVLLLLGGMIIPLEDLPAGLEAVAKVLPAAALARVMNNAFSGESLDIYAFGVLLVWAVAAPVAATLTFRWE
jgi:ABC-2 type transport system permease protein